MCFSDHGLPTPHSASVNLSLYALAWKPHVQKQTFFLWKDYQIPWEITGRKVFQYFKTHQAQRSFAISVLPECIADREK